MWLSWLASVAAARGEDHVSVLSVWRRTAQQCNRHKVYSGDEFGWIPPTHEFQGGSRFRCEEMLRRLTSWGNPAAADYDKNCAVPLWVAVAAGSCTKSEH
eukprot:2526755-Amphidinium_carterae.1